MDAPTSYIFMRVASRSSCGSDFRDDAGRMRNRSQCHVALGWHWPLCPNSFSRCPLWSPGARMPKCPLPPGVNNRRIQSHRGTTPGTDPSYQTLAPTAFAKHNPKIPNPTAPPPPPRFRYITVQFRQNAFTDQKPPIRFHPAENAFFDAKPLTNHPVPAFHAVSPPSTFWIGRAQALQLRQFAHGRSTVTESHMAYPQGTLLAWFQYT